MTATTYANPSEDLVLVVTRIFDAPRGLVFKMFTDPKHLAQFWGPKGFISTVREMDARPGGAFHIDMRAMAPYVRARASIATSSSPSGSSTAASRMASTRAAAGCLRARS
jgi:hypothetical protein